MKKTKYKRVCFPTSLGKYPYLSFTFSNNLEGVTELELEKHLYLRYNKDVKFRTFKRDGGKTLKTFLYTPE